MASRDLVDMGVGQRDDEYLFGWDPTPGIVSVWANREGQAVVWRRDAEQIYCEKTRYYPWILAISLADVSSPASNLHPFPEAGKPLLSSHIYYRELEGPQQSYRYLLFACDLRTIERAVLRGASKRLSKQVTHLNQLDWYYTVGSVEQYLMQTGRVYFRGLEYEALHRLQIDFETTSLDPHRGRIFLAAVSDTRGLSVLLEAPQPEDEKQLLLDLGALVRTHDPDVIENHNLFGFDLPFWEYRAQLHQLPIELGRQGGPLLLTSREETITIGSEARKRTRYSVAGRELIDTLDAVRRHDFVVRDMSGYGLKEVARYFGLASQERTYIPGKEIFATYQSDPDRVRRYAMDDVWEVEGISRRLLGAPFALAQMAPRTYERLAFAGPAMGILEPLLVRSYLRRGAALPYQAARASAEDGLHEGGAVHLFATGIAKHVVKADVASLYPSLMAQYQIGPSCDRLGVFLSILERLRLLRLHHKEAARSALPGSMEANHHHATQAAMKILINAAYGYMGAGSMALFADGRAAGEVTRQGRLLLDQIVARLRARGIALIEADTDGVYFAVPPSWDEQQERSLVAEIDATLATGIHLEYEGRYQAMFSHEVKNYALLTYSDRLLVHGVALRSSRAEPFGEQFLHKALLATMQGDIPGVRTAYLETVERLRTRQFQVADVATRVRLSKTPETYLVARKNHQEPAYEALINAGRTDWHPGERVRFYRTLKKRYIWLPDENEETSLRMQANGKREQAREEEKSFQLLHDYDIEYYIQVLTTSYAARLRKAFSPADFEQLFSHARQLRLFEFETPIEEVQALLIHGQAPMHEK